MTTPRDVCGSHVSTRQLYRIQVSNNSTFQETSVAAMLLLGIYRIQVSNNSMFQETSVAAMLLLGIYRIQVSNNSTFHPRDIRGSHVSNWLSLVDSGQKIT
jgi:hypothetical protein